MVEHLTLTQKVVGSKPAISTINRKFIFINYCNSESREVGIAPVLGTGELRRFESCLSDIVMMY